MAVAIAFLRENAVVAIQISCISIILILNGFYSIISKKCNSHGHLICIRKHKITPKSCCLSAIMLCSIDFELFYVDLTGSIVLVWIPTEILFRKV